jgi:hypothetical protein
MPHGRVDRSRHGRRRCRTRREPGARSSRGGAGIRRCIPGRSRIPRRPRGRPSTSRSLRRPQDHSGRPAEHTDHLRRLPQPRSVVPAGAASAPPSARPSPAARPGADARLTGPAQPAKPLRPAGPRSSSPPRASRSTSCATVIQLDRDAGARRRRATPHPDGRVAWPRRRRHFPLVGPGRPSRLPTGRDHAETTTSPRPRRRPRTREPRPGSTRVVSPPRRRRAVPDRRLGCRALHHGHRIARGAQRERHRPRLSLPSTECRPTTTRVGRRHATSSAAAPDFRSDPIRWRRRASAAARCAMRRAARRSTSGEVRLRRSTAAAGGLAHTRRGARPTYPAAHRREAVSGSRRSDDHGPARSALAAGPGAAPSGGPSMPHPVVAACPAVGTRSRGWGVGARGTPPERRAG